MFDSHVHAGPDITERRRNDTELADDYVKAGYDGFVLKAHYESTVGRAKAIAQSTGLEVFGGIALNQNCGGVNPSAVAASLSSGGRVVWMPTADAHTQHAAGLPRLCNIESRLPARHYAIPPIDDTVTEDVDLVLELISEHDAVLATGHLSGEECWWLLDRAKSFGIKRFLLTHPSYTVPGLAPDEISDFARNGAHIEITAFQLFHQQSFGAEQLAEVADAAGDLLVLSSDAGQVNSPSAPDALQTLIDDLVSSGCNPQKMLTAAAETPKNLFSPG